MSDLPGGLKAYTLSVGGTTWVVGPPAPFEPEHTRRWLEARPWGVGTVLMPGVKSADDLFERARAVGAEVLEPPTDQPWGARTVTLRDPDGYVLMFDQPKRAPRPKPKAKAKKAAKAAKRRRAR